MRSGNLGGTGRQGNMGLRSTPLEEAECIEFPEEKQGF